MSVVMLTTRSCAFGLVEVKVQSLVTELIVNLESRLISSCAVVPSLIPDRMSSLSVTMYSCSAPGHGPERIIWHGEGSVLKPCEMRLRKMLQGALGFARINAK